MLLESDRFTQKRIIAERYSCQLEIQLIQFRIMLKFVLLLLQTLESLDEGGIKEAYEANTSIKPKQILNQSKQVEVEPSDLRTEIESVINKIINFPWDKQGSCDFLEYPKLEKELIVLVQKYIILGGTLSDLTHLTDGLDSSVICNLGHPHVEISNPYNSTP